jgi:hypothetical protein
MRHDGASYSMVNALPVAQWRATAGSRINSTDNPLLWSIAILGYTVSEAVSPECGSSAVAQSGLFRRPSRRVTRAVGQPCGTVGVR